MKLTEFLETGPMEGPAEGPMEGALQGRSEGASQVLQLAEGSLHSTF